jgi:hypothetical protein
VFWEPRGHGNESVGTCSLQESSTHGSERPLRRGDRLIIKLMSFIFMENGAKTEARTTVRLHYALSDERPPFPVYGGHVGVDCRPTASHAERATRQRIRRSRCELLLGHSSESSTQEHCTCTLGDALCGDIPAPNSPLHPRSKLLNALHCLVLVTPSVLFIGYGLWVSSVSPPLFLSARAGSVSL